MIIPKDNEKDLADIPKKVKNMMSFFPVEHVNEVLKLALYEKPEEAEDKEPLVGEEKPPPSDIADTTPSHIIKH